MNLIQKNIFLLLSLMLCWQFANAQTTCVDPTATYQYDNSADPDDCCWFINISNSGVSNLITAVTLDNFQDCEIGALSANGGWTINNQSTTGATILPNTPFIQPGSYPQQFRVCLGNRTAIPHFFDVVFMETDPGGVYQEYCRVNFALDCPLSPIDTCTTTACFIPSYQGGTTYNFDATCSTGNGSITYDWDFGDGNTSTLMNPTHTYTSNQPVYNVCLITTNTLPGSTTICADTICQLVDSPVDPPTDCTLSCPADVIDLVVNGDFSAGDVNFGSSLNSNCTCLAASYCVTTDATLKCNNSFWNPVMSPTLDNYMVIDGNTGSVWSQSVNVIGGKTYNFSFDYYPNISGDPSPDLSLHVGGSALLSNITGTLDMWTTHCVDFTASVDGTVLLEIRQDNSVGFDDYGIDNVSFSTCCDLEVSLPDTMTICANDMAQLNPVVTGAQGAVTYQWSPATDLSNPNIENPIATPSTITTYTVTATDSLGCQATATVTVNPVVCPCDNLVVNGDFENGDNGFTSGISTSCTCLAGSYCIDANARDKCTNSFWQSIVAPQGFGDYMIVDGSGGNTIWSQNITVAANSVYDFCFDYYPDISGGSTPQLQVEVFVSGTPTTLLTTTGSAGSWQKYCAAGWFSGAGGVVELRITQLNAPGFDDFGIDNIQFGTCCEIEVSLPDTMTVCTDDMVQLNPVVSGAIGPVVSYSWSPATGLSNPNIANPTTSVSSQITYTVTATDSLGCEATASVTVNPVVCPCDNLVFNGDFESGDNGFTSGIPTSCTCLAGSYCIDANARDKCTNSFWQSIVAPQGFGDYMIVDGSGGNTIWSQNITVAANSVYDFCFDYYPDISGGSTPQLQVEVFVSGTPTTLLTTTGSAGSWQKYCAAGWFSGAGGVVELRITQLNAPGFDDFGIDNIQFGTCCEIEVSLPDTMTVCTDDMVQLNPVVSGAIGPVVSYSWSPATGLSNPNIANPTTSVSSQITYTVTATDSLGCEATASVTVNPVVCPCDNLVFNGDFENGDNGFTSGIPTSCTCLAGSYCIDANARDKCTNSFWQSIVAPQGFGDYMIVDGSGGNTIWSQNITVAANSVYDFCFDYYPDISGGSTPQLQVEVFVSGTPTTLLTTTGSAGSWQKYCAAGWFSGAGGVVELRITQLNAPGFDDFGIDNIQFGTCCEIEVSLPNTMTVCTDDMVQLNPVVSGAIGPVVSYSWSPATGLSNPNIANPMATVTNLTTYTVTVTDSIGCEALAMVTVDPVACPCDTLAAGQSGINLDFESGLGGFTTGSFTSNCTCAAQTYCLTTDARLKCSNSLWQGVLAPDGFSNYMVVDGGSGIVLSGNVFVDASYTYDFCFDYYPDISGGGTPQILVEVYQGATLLTTLVTTTGTAGSWQKICSSGWAPSVTGTVELRITQNTNPNFSDYGIDNVEFGTCDEVVGIFQPTAFTGTVSIYPNPTNDLITIELGESLNVDVEYQLYDLLGRQLLRDKITQGLTRQDLRLEGLAEGVYVLLIGNAETGFYQERIVKHNK